MGCNRVDLGNGDFVITCSRGRARPQCEVCKQRPHEVLCDFPLTGAKAGKTCDRKLCRACAKHVGANADLCPPHAKLGLPQTELALGGKP
ncbi:MAG: hypothetical protein JWO36_4135 [Myxococcales bacterium]|nr:hypothetical protein [Myxococcales bacterium]